MKWDCAAFITSLQSAPKTHQLTFRGCKISPDPTPLATSAWMPWEGATSARLAPWTKVQWPQPAPGLLLGPSLQLVSAGAGASVFRLSILTSCDSQSMVLFSIPVFQKTKLKTREAKYQRHTVRRWESQVSLSPRKRGQKHGVLSLPVGGLPLWYRL